MLILGLVEVPWCALPLLAILGYILYSCRHFNYFRSQALRAELHFLYWVPFIQCSNSLAYTDMKNLELAGDDGYVGEFFGGRPALMVFDENMLTEIMVKDFTSFPNRTTIRGNDPITNSMLVNLDDDHWKHVRNEMTPTFTTGKLKKMNEEINRCGKSLADNLLESAKLHETIEAKEYTGGFTMDVIASTAFGIRVESQKDRNNAFVTHAKKAFEFNPARPKLFIQLFFPELAFLLMRLGVSFDFFAKEVSDFFHNITRQTMEMRKGDADQSRTDFVQLMINAQKLATTANENQEQNSEKSSFTGLSDNEILANAMLFFGAGYDTTATTLSFLFYNLAVNPDCQERLVEEINRVVGSKESVDYSLLQEMPYLEQCISETLRMYPAAIRVNRKANRDVTINGVFLKKDLVLNIPVYAIHHDAKKWPEPEKFDPERFTAERKKERNPYHFLPFGNGPRNCIGMRLAMQELKVATIHVFRKVKLSRSEKTQVPIVFGKGGALLKAKDGIWLKASPRVEE